MNIGSTTGRTETDRFFKRPIQRKINNIDGVGIKIKHQSTE